MPAEDILRTSHERVREREREREGGRGRGRGRGRERQRQRQAGRKTGKNGIGYSLMHTKVAIKMPELTTNMR